MWELQQRVGIADIQNFEEDYMGFELSNGWLTGFKTWNGLAKQRYAGNAGSTDPVIIEPARVHLQDALENRLPGDVYNIFM